MLIAEERKIDGRRRERERKAQDLQKLITSVERAPMTPTSAMSSMSLSLTAAAGHKKNKIYRNKNGGASTPNLMLGVTGAGASSGAGAMVSFLLLVVIFINSRLMRKRLVGGIAQR